MFEQVFENLRKATDSTIHMQQEMYQKWLGLWPVMPPSAPTFGEPAKFQKKWMEIAADLLKKQRETLETQFSAGLKQIEEAFRLTEAKDPEEMRARTVELWQKSFEALRKLYEAQVRDFQGAITKWTELYTKGAA
jgi:hypothetical protein